MATIDYTHRGDIGPECVRMAEIMLSRKITPTCRGLPDVLNSMVGSTILAVGMINGSQHDPGHSQVPVNMEGGFTIDFRTQDGAEKRMVLGYTELGEWVEVIGNLHDEAVPELDDLWEAREEFGWYPPEWKRHDASSDGLTDEQRQLMRNARIMSAENWNGLKKSLFGNPDAGKESPT